VSESVCVSKSASVLVSVSEYVTVSVCFASL